MTFEQRQQLLNELLTKLSTKKITRKEFMLLIDTLRYFNKKVVDYEEVTL